MGWSEVLLDTLKENDVRLVTYVPDNVLTPLIKGVDSDNYFISINATREDEAIGTVAGAWMGGIKGAVLMQTSGFAVIPNALASLIVPYQIPAIMFVSERGTLGEFNIGQVMVSRLLRPTLDTLGVAHHTLTDESTMRFDQAGGHDAKPGRVHPLAAPDRRQSGRTCQAEIVRVIRGSIRSS
jgi:sulfopyruvate decarboxylase TPP-binding subunit